ncbi:MAG: hypothetical protein HKM26_04395 [Winogradskyella sp.]|nr:hypothetical protein [Winogradskyella sp.]
MNFSRISKKNKITITVIGLLSALMSIFFSSIVEFLLDFAHTYLNPYNATYTKGHEMTIQISVGLLILLGILICCSLLFKWHSRIYNLLNRLFQFNDLKNLIFSDPLTTKSHLSKNVFVISVFIALVLHIKQLLIGDIHSGTMDEHILEYLSSILLIIAAVILIVSIVYLKNINIEAAHKKIISRILIPFSLLLVLVFLEEISWGQQFLKWESPDMFIDTNFQNETNLHNFINPFLRFLYPMIGIGLFIILFLLWFYYKGDKPFWLKLLTPHPSLSYMAFFMACTSYAGISEIFELLLYPFILLYSIRILMCLKYPNSVQLKPKY